MGFMLKLKISEGSEVVSKKKRRTPKFLFPGSPALAAGKANYIIFLNLGH